MKIGIAGYGFVGQAHKGALKDYHDIIVNDPALGHYGDLRHSDAIIVCVSTPEGSHGGCHMDNVYDVIKDSPDVPILIKSTISIEGWDMLKHVFPNKQLTFSPEFLRAETALEDFQNTKTILLGGGNTGFWADLFVAVLGYINIDIATAQELILTKYARNSFLALKVAYFNQIKDLCTKLDVDYNEVRKYTTLDDRIGKSHTTITDERGFGGHCFPKDTKAFVTTSKRVDSNLSILEHAIKYNQRIRKGTI
jgi:UDPglucose 6-dehydrogenase|tara:strand:- start:638 stop:1390 length:753 start_codon:yes stop_codon:yes gene_type:complete